MATLRSASVRVEIDEAALQAMIRDWGSPVGEAIREATSIVEDTARITAPVSPVGSKYAPTGFLKAGVHEALDLHHDTDGTILGLVGAPRYPMNFLRNPTSNKGYTWNRGRKTTRPGNNRFLDDSLNSLAGFVRYID